MRPMRIRASSAGSWANQRPGLECQKVVGDFGRHAVQERRAGSWLGHVAQKSAGKAAGRGLQRWRCRFVALRADFCRLHDRRWRHSRQTFDPAQTTNGDTHENPDRPLGPVRRLPPRPPQHPYPFCGCSHDHVCGGAAAVAPRGGWRVCPPVLRWCGARLAPFTCGWTCAWGW